MATREQVDAIQAHIKKKFKELDAELHNNPNANVIIPGEKNKKAGDISLHNKNATLNYSAHGHRLGTGLAKGQFENDKLWKETIVITDQEVIKLIQKYPDRVHVGWVGKDVGTTTKYTNKAGFNGPPSKDLIHVFGANVTNYNHQSDIGEIIDGGGQAGHMGEQVEGVFGIVTTPKELTLDQIENLKENKHTTAKKSSLNQEPEQKNGKAAKRNTPKKKGEEDVKKPHTTKTPPGPTKGGEVELQPITKSDPLTPPAAARRAPTKPPAATAARITPAAAAETEEEKQSRIKAQEIARSARKQVLSGDLQRLLAIVQQETPNLNKYGPDALQAQANKELLDPILIKQQDLNLRDTLYKKNLYKADLEALLEKRSEIDIHNKEKYKEWLDKLEKKVKNSTFSDISKAALKWAIEKERDPETPKKLEGFIEAEENSSIDKQAKVDDLLVRKGAGAAINSIVQKGTGAAFNFIIRTNAAEERAHSRTEKLANDVFKELIKESPFLSTQYTIDPLYHHENKGKNPEDHLSIEKLEKKYGSDYTDLRQSLENLQKEFAKELHEKIIKDLQEKLEKIEEVTEKHIRQRLIGGPALATAFMVGSLAFPPLLLITLPLTAILGIIAAADYIKDNDQKAEIEKISKSNVEILTENYKKKHDYIMKNAVEKYAKKNAVREFEEKAIQELLLPALSKKAQTLRTELGKTTDPTTKKNKIQEYFCKKKPNKECEQDAKEKISGIINEAGDSKAPGYNEHILKEIQKLFSTDELEAILPRNGEDDKTYSDRLAEGLKELQSNPGEIGKNFIQLLAGTIQNQDFQDNVRKFETENAANLEEIYKGGDKFDNLLKIEHAYIKQLESIGKAPNEIENMSLSKKKEICQDSIIAEKINEINENYETHKKDLIQNFDKMAENTVSPSQEQEKEEAAELEGFKATDKPAELEVFKATDKPAELGEFGVEAEQAEKLEDFGARVKSEVEEVSIGVTDGDKKDKYSASLKTLAKTLAEEAVVELSKPKVSEQPIKPNVTPDSKQPDTKVRDL